MCLAFIQGESAMCSENTQRVITEIICKTGRVESVEYLWLFREKDKRRIQFCVAAFWASYVVEKNEQTTFDVFEGADGSLDKLFKYIPAMRKMVRENAAKIDFEKKAKIDEKTCEESAREALGKLDEGLEALQALVLPIDKKHQPVQDNEMEEDNKTADELLEKIPEKVKNWFTYAGETLKLDTRNKRKFYTEAKTTTRTTTTTTTTTTRLS